MGWWTKSVLAAVVMGAAVGSARGQCPVVASVTAESLTCAIRVRWTQAPDSPAASAWQVYRNTGSAVAGATLVAIRSGTTFEFTDTTASHSQSYSYFIRGVSSACPSGPASDFVVGATSSMEVPNVRAEAAGCGRVRVSWDAVPNVGGYEVARLLGNVPTVIASVTPDQLSVTDAGGLPGVEYRYTLKAFASCGVSRTNNEATARVPSLPRPTAGIDKLMVQAGASGFFALPFGGVEAVLNPRYRWLKDGQPLTLGGRITANESVLEFTQFRIEDVGNYTVEVTTDCGTASQTLMLAVRPIACRADFNESGGVSVQDVFDYLAAWFGGCP